MTSSKDTYIEYQSIRAYDEWQNSFRNRHIVDYTSPLTPSLLDQVEQSIQSSNIYYNRDNESRTR